LEDSGEEDRGSDIGPECLDEGSGDKGFRHPGGGKKHRK